MFYLEGWSMKEVADKLNITLNEALTKRNNALRRLRCMERSELEAYLLHGVNGRNEILWDQPNQFEEIMLKLAQDVEDENEYDKSVRTSYSIEECKSDVSACQNLADKCRAIEHESIRKNQNHDTIMCEICKSGAAKGEWIYLTDGSRIHSACYDQISSYISNKESELDELKNKKEKLQQKWKREL